MQIYFITAFLSTLHMTVTIDLMPKLKEKHVKFSDMVQILYMKEC